jgi:hypothetical protein
MLPRVSLIGVLARNGFSETTVHAHEPPSSHL